MVDRALGPATTRPLTSLPAGTPAGPVEAPGADPGPPPAAGDERAAALIASPWGQAVRPAPALDRDPGIAAAIRQAEAADAGSGPAPAARRPGAPSRPRLQIPPSPGRQTRIDALTGMVDRIAVLPAGSEARRSLAHDARQLAEALYGPALEGLARAIRILIDPSPTAAIAAWLEEQAELERQKLKAFLMLRQSVPPRLWEMMKTRISAMLDQANVETLPAIVAEAVSLLWAARRAPGEAGVDDEKELAKLRDELVADLRAEKRRARERDRDKPRASTEARPPVVVDVASKDAPAR